LKTGGLSGKNIKHCITKQVTELLNEVKPSLKKSDAVTRFVEKLRSVLFRMKQVKRDHQVFCNSTVSAFL